MRWWREWLTALQFMTRLPVPAFRFSPELVQGAAKLFPLVGLLLGALAAALAWLLWPHLPTSLVAAVALIALAFMTGGMHEDGLADSCDGLGAGGSKERMLTIMRDSRIGSFGALAVMFSVLLRWSALSSLPASQFYAYLIAAQVASRWTVLPLAYFLPPARADGLGKKFAGLVSRGALVLGSVLALAVLIALLRDAAWRPALAALLAGGVTAAVYRAKLGGITGDGFGAAIQLTEIAVYCSALWR